MVGRPILVVDDDPMIRLFLAELFQTEGYPVETASNGAEALEVLERQRPSLLVMDMHMPVMDGWTLVREIHERGLDPPIIVLTATARNADRSGEEVGADASFAKPFELTELLDVVEQLRVP